jgi:HEAT repeat protein
MRRLAGLLITVALTALASPSASAQGQVSLAEAKKKLNSSEAETIRSGIEAIGLLGTPRGIGPLSERIRQGLPPELLSAALDTLSVLGHRRAGPILFELAQHRRASVRAKAVQAIAASEPKGAARALQNALADSEAAVRSAAALGLGKLGATDALDSLFVALDRGVVEAATALGQLVRAKEVDRLLGYLGELPLNTLTPALSEVLARDDLKNEVKLEVIARLGEMATPGVKRFLQDYVASLPPKTRGRDPVRKAAEDAIVRIAH